MKNIEKNPKENNRDYAYRVIRENLITMELKPGSMISEQDLADELHLSRTPVHEALQELARTQIVEVLPQRGSLVSLINMKLVDEAIFMRSTIEVALTEEACKIATEKDIQTLEENVTLQEFYLQKLSQNSQPALDKIMELDNAFHEEMYKITNKLLCHNIVQQMNIHFDRYRELKLHTSNPSDIIQEHKAILDAFKKQDCENLKKLILNHLTRKFQNEHELREKYPDYFS